MHTPALTVSGSRSEASNWRAWSARDARRLLEHELDALERRAGRDDQQLVRSGTTEDDVRGQVGAQALHDRQQRVVAGFVPVGAR